MQCRGAASSTGARCRKPAIAGGTVCRLHGGAAPRVAAKAAVRAEVLRWGLTEAHADPGEVLLRLVTQSAQRAERYARLLEEAYDAAERLRTAHEAHVLVLTDQEHDEEPAALQQARLDLDRVFTTGGVAALVGHTVSDTKTGELYVTGEYIRGLATLEAQERDRCAGFAAKAVAAGLDKRRVELAERQGALIADLLRAVLADDELGLTEEQRRAVPGVTRRHLSVVAAG